FGERRPETHGTAPDGELRRDLPPSILEAQQQPLPALRRLPVAFLDVQKMLAPSRVAADYDQQAPPLIRAHVQINPVRPQIHELVPAPVFLPPVGVLCLPGLLEPRDRRRRQALHRLAEQRFERLVETVRRHPLQVQPRNYRLEPPRLLQVRRQKLRGKTPALPRSVPGLRRLHLHRSDASEYLPLRLVAVAHHGSATLSVSLRRVLVPKHLQLRFNRLPNDPWRAIAHQIAELVSKGWITKRNNRIVAHGWRISSIAETQVLVKPNFS